MLLEKINAPGDIRKIKPAQYELLAKEIRQFLLEKVSRKGGHLASNLGVVELTMALHLVFDPEKDRIVWDVGHQSYIHKLLTGRKDQFDSLRDFGGLSGFPKREESPCDSFDAGHSSTSVSAALGLAEARNLLGQNHKVIAVIGDGALTGGMALEALNNVSDFHGNLIIILNDNEMSISRNTGGISRHLNKIRSHSGYNALKTKVKNGLETVPFGKPIARSVSYVKNGIKKLTVSDILFENMGITCWGPVDGHDLNALISMFKSARKLDKPVLIHVITKKGKGYLPAELHPEKFHGVSPFDIKTGKSLKSKSKDSWTDVFAKSLLKEAKKDERIVAITAAMSEGTGLTSFAIRYPDRFYNVGIAEQHAVTFAAGLAVGGMKPVFAVYSSFLQRSYDQIIHDVCIQDLPVVFAVDRAGIVGKDGKTHQGLLDLSFLSEIPGMTVCAPKNAWELGAMLEFAFGYGHPVAIRYPRGNSWDGLSEYKTPVAAGRAEILQRGSRVALLSIGSMVEVAESVRMMLSDKEIEATSINLRFASPLDQRTILDICASHELIVTMEENVYTGGVGEHIQALCQSHGILTKFLPVCIPDIYLTHGDPAVLRQYLEIDAESVVTKINNILENQE